MPDRRAFLAFAATVATGLPRPGAAQTASDRAAAFIRKVGDHIIAVMRGPGSQQEKRGILGPIIDAAVDVDGVGRFCLGRFWRIASPDQKTRYLAAFHQVLVGNITTKLGEYKEVRLTVGRSQPRDDTDVVSSTVEQPNNPPTSVEWVVADAAHNPKIVDVIAEGTSLRLTQRSDYTAYLTRNNNNVDALIKAMTQRLAQENG